jgi:hypothetical protein
MTPQATKLYCCFHHCADDCVDDGQHGPHGNCKADAEFEIIEQRTDLHPADNSTHACRAHVGEMLGSTKMDPPTRSWVVVEL